MPTIPSVINRLAQAKPPQTEPLWQGPSGAGPNGGITQSMLCRWLVCRERFKVHYVMGLQQARGWNHLTGYGSMWHVCEEAFAAGGTDIGEALYAYCQKEKAKYPMDRAKIDEWAVVCAMQFPEYAAHWQRNADVVARTPLMQEQVFDMPYPLPSGRTVRLRGMFDSVDLIDAHQDEDGQSFPKGVWLTENKTKGDVDRRQLERQLKFDLQTMLYLTALELMKERPTGIDGTPILGVRYNVVKRPFSGGTGNIRPHAAKVVKEKCYKTKPNVPGYTIPAETWEHCVERLRDDYIQPSPHEWFFRWKVPTSPADVLRFRRETLDPILEQLCWWYDMATDVPPSSFANWEHLCRSLNFRMPYGVYSPLLDGGESETDEFLNSGNMVGLRSVDRLFEELQHADHPR